MDDERTGDAGMGIACPAVGAADDIATPSS
jgi:hypothetical protein